ncbi:MAG: DNA-binding response regulator [Bacteroidales bacterium]|nr:DNA-binding response regulator [Bacteroidales bacterium]
MHRQRVNIGFIEPADIVYEGLSGLLLKYAIHFFFFRLKEFNELNVLCSKENLDVVILNPVVVQNKSQEFSKIKKQFPGIAWIGLIYSIFDSETMGKFDDTIQITDSLEVIVNKISRTIENDHNHNHNQGELSEREIEVLIQLVKGFSNKEIADNLNISIHTVISHRKNIIEKTGIRSLPGLTIYAISKKIIPLDYL